MSDNHASKKLPSRIYHLKDVEYFDYFKAQIEISGAVLDKFGKEFDQINVNDFNAIIHYNWLQVIKHMVKKRRGYIEEIIRLAELKEQNGTQIAILESEKQQRIKELESFWTIEKTNLESQIAQLKAEAETLKKDAKTNNGISERYRTERNTAERELENMKETLEFVNAECKTLKENNVQLEADLKATNNQIQNQLKQIVCLQEQCEKYKKELDEIRKEKNQTAERKSAALEALVESVKDVREKTSCKRVHKANTATTEGNVEKLKLMEEQNQTLENKIDEQQQNIINYISAQYSILFKDNLHLDHFIGKQNVELENAKKWNQINDKRAEKRRLPKEPQQQHQTENNKRNFSARHDIHIPSPMLNFLSPTGQQLYQGPISTAFRTLPSPSNLSAQFLRPAKQRVDAQPNAFPFLIPHLNPGSGPSNMNFSPQFYNFPPHLQQEILQHQEMMNRRLNVSNGAPPPTNPPMNSINNRQQQQQQQQQLPSPNSIPEMMPQQQKHHQMSPEQLNAFKQWQQQEQQPQYMTQPLQEQHHPPFLYPPHILSTNNPHQQLQEQYQNN